MGCLYMSDINWKRDKVVKLVINVLYIKCSKGITKTINVKFV